MIFKFVDSTTADGYNPYRVLREGFEWEIIDAHDPWSFIGYWGDHQVIYLLKLLEASERYHPGTLEALLGRRVFTYANVPYRLKPYQEMLANPRSTIAFDQEAHEQTMALAGKIGADGKLLMDLHGIFRGNLTEKLLVVALSKLSNFIPEAGIWMNTQRPEWNDANNALVGHGVSVVTLCYLRRYLAFCQDLFKAPGAVEISVEIADMLASVASTFEKHAPLLDGYLSDRDRKAVLDALGEAGTVYREKIYGKGFSGDLASMPFERLQAFCEVALRHIDHAIRANRRADGLYHAYNLMKVVGDGIEIRHLYKMLEGQVAVLSSGTLTGEESVEVLDALRASNLYRGDLGSYMLYPDRALPHFLEKNILPDDAASRSELLRVLLKAGNRRIVTRDAEGRIRFNASFRSSVDLKAELAAMLQTEYRLLVEKDTSVVLDLYEEVFDHQSFTGRSGTFFKYEGLGCVYWHMVSKLLLAVDEVKRAAGSRDTVTLAQLDRHYQEIREGLGVHKSPLDYGAIPTDPYSHTPGFAGVQQPGMTGQVKEDFLTRFSEMGVQVQAGCLAFQPWMVPQREFLRRSTTFRCINVLGHPLDLALEPGTLGFTVCQVPIVAHRGGGPSIQVTRQDGSVQQIDGLTLGEPESRAIFERTCEIERLDVYLGLP
jgi:hypothetical protein